MPSYEWANEIKLGRKKIVVWSNIPRSPWPLRGEEVYDLWAAIAAAIPNTSWFQLTSEKWQPNWYASLDWGGKVPASQLPSYVDDVLEFPNLAWFPAVWETGKIYVDIATNKTYRWTGSAYIEVSPSSISQSTANGWIITDSGGWTAVVSWYASTAPTTPFTGMKWTDTSTTPSTQKVWNGTAWILDDSTASITANNDLWISWWILQQGFPLVKNTDTLLSTFTRSYTGSTGGKFNIWDDWTVTANWTVADTIVIQPATWTQSIWLNIRATNWSSTVAGNLWMVWWNNWYAQWSVLGDMVLRNLDATKKLIFWLNQTTPFMQLTPTGLKLMYTTASANATATIDIDGEATTRNMNVQRRTTTWVQWSNLVISAWWTNLSSVDQRWWDLYLRPWTSTWQWWVQTLIQAVAPFATSWTNNNSSYFTLASFRSTYVTSWRVDTIWFALISEKTNANANYLFNVKWKLQPQTNSSDQPATCVITTTFAQPSWITNLQSIWTQSDYRFTATADASVWVIEPYRASITLDSNCPASTIATQYIWFRSTLARSSWTSVMNITWDVSHFAVSNTWSTMYSCVNHYGFDLSTNWVNASWESIWFYARSLSSWTTNRAWVKIDAPTAWATGVTAWLWLTDISGTTRGWIFFWWAWNTTNIYRKSATTLRMDWNLSIWAIPTFASDALAWAWWLTTGDLYKSAAWQLFVKL